MWSFNPQVQKVIKDLNLNESSLRRAGVADVYFRTAYSTVARENQNLVFPEVYSDKHGEEATTAVRRGLNPHQYYFKKSPPPPPEEDYVMERMHEELHGRIREGNLESVELLLQDVKPGLPLCFDGMSALKRSFTCKQVNVSTFLIHFGATFKDNAEEEDLDISEEDTDLINVHFWYFNRDVEESCVYKLMADSKLAFPGNKLSNDALLRMYQELFQSECIRCLMKVLEKEPLHIAYDFGSKNIDRIYLDAETGLSGLTVPSTNSIYIGAEELLSEKAEERAKVKGVVAEEFCHLALQYLFENCSKPYKVTEENSHKVKTYRDLVFSLKSDAEKEGSLPPIIQDLFIGGVYETDVFERELIARVPHLMGIHGEKVIRDTFKNSSKLTQLIKFYDDSVIPACKRFTDPLYHSRPMVDLQSLHTEKGYIMAKEKVGITFRENLNFFEEYLVDYMGMKVLYTNITKLCALHMYHEFKERITYHVDKVCLFFTLDTFEEIKRDLKQKYKSELIQYIILIVEKIQIERIRKVLGTYICGDDNSKVVIISRSDTVNPNGILYKWNDVPYEFKELFLEGSFKFKGNKCCFKDYLEVQDLTKVFENDIATFEILTGSGELLKLDDGADLFSQHYTRHTYIERNFQAMSVDIKTFKDIQCYNIFLSGFKKGGIKELPFDKNLVQWIRGSDEEIQSDKSIFIINEERPISFEELTRKTQNKKCIWLHYDEREFYVRNFNSSGDVFSCHLKQKTVSEEGILDFLKRERVILISDNAGCGKSTVVSSLIDKLTRIDIQTWNWRLNFNKFSGNIADPLSIAHIEEESSDKEVLEHLFLMLGLKNGLERHLFREFAKRGHCFICFDGFDEIPSEYVSNALKLLSTIRKETNVNMVISTRKHHQEKLEQLLNTYSHQLAPISRKDQLRYLENLWKSKLKYPCGNELENSLKEEKKVPEKIKKILKESKKRKTKSVEEMKDLILALENIDLRDSLDSVRSKIDDLNFCKLAEHVIERISLDTEILQFMGIPLHLFMIGMIYFDCNFNVEIKSDIHSIYSKFIEQKILIYMEEKQGILRDGREKEEIFKKRKKDAYRIHIELSNQLTDKGKLDTDTNKEDLELCTALGIVFINGTEINFLHQTFAEFFKAESIRLNLNKEGFIQVLFEDKYKIVRRFLLSSLERNAFENLRKGFLDDFLSDFLEQFVHKSEKFDHWARNYELNSYFSNVIEIVKCLLETFEKTADEDLLSEFLEKLKSEISSERWYSVGGCLTVKMLTVLFHQNIHLEMIFGVFKYYTNPHEVVDVLKECISILTAEECDAIQKDNENKKVLSKVLKFEDSRGRGLLEWALWNGRTEIFANILKFSMDILGREEFIDSIIRSKEYIDAMDVFIKLVDFNRISGFLKEFHSVFGSQIECLFDVSLKFRILKRVLRVEDESSNAFEEVIKILIEYFGMETVKEALLGFGSKGKYLIHHLVSKNGSIIKNLNVIRNILEDEGKVKQFLVSKNGELRNMFHLVAANRSINMGDVLGFCHLNLEGIDLKEMLISVDEAGDNVLHLLFKYKPFDELIEKLKLIKNCLADEELFKQLLKSRDGRLRSLLHLAAENGDINFGEILQFCHENLEKCEIKEMLFSGDEYGDNALHRLFANNSSEALIDDFNLIKNTLADDDWFKQFVRSKGGNLSNIFHDAAWNRNEINVSFLNFHLNRGEIKDLLIERDENGWTCLHCAPDDYSKNLPFWLDYLYEMLNVVGSHFEDIILAQDKRGNTFLHFFVGRYSLCGTEEADFVNVIIKSLKQKVSDDTFKKLLRIRNYGGKTFLQVESDYSLEIIECFEGILEENLFEELLQSKESGIEDMYDGDYDNEDDCMIYDEFA